MSSLIAYRVCFVLLLVSGRVAARLAADFRVLAEHRERFGLLTVLLQLPVFVCWLLVRPISLAAYSGCRAFAPRLQSWALRPTPRAPSPSACRTPSR
jgi:hypothetical protein